jgi:hypothetical protein
LASCYSPRLSPEGQISVYFLSSEYSYGVRDDVQWRAPRSRWLTSYMAMIRSQRPQTLHREISKCEAELLRTQLLRYQLARRADRTQIPQHTAALLHVFDPTWTHRKVRLWFKNNKAMVERHILSQPSGSRQFPPEVTPLLAPPTPLADAPDQPTARRTPDAITADATCRQECQTPRHITVRFDPIPPPPVLICPVPDWTIPSEIQSNFQTRRFHVDPRRSTPAAGTQ